ncbi:MAG: zinc-ribbon domain-containing protein [Actinobacteria bacterium]|nr:zinc-ribbon domain-containing protein [Actinomycetota bacterium]
MPSWIGPWEILVILIIVAFIGIPVVVLVVVLSSADRRGRTGAQGIASMTTDETGMIRFACPGCGNELSVAGSQAGGQGRCLKCGAVVTAPIPAYASFTAGFADPTVQPTPTNHGTPVAPLAPPRFCSACGNPLKDGASFCSGCGGAV